MPNIEELIEQYGDGVYSLCRRLTDCRFDADDLYQQTFLIAMGKQFRDDGNAKALLTRICIAQWKNEVRKRSRRSRIAPVSNLESEHIRSQQELEHELAEKQQMEALNRIVQGLDERCRLPVLLHYGMELPLSEIAKILRVPVGTVKSRLANARGKIKKELEVTGYER